MRKRYTLRLHPVRTCLALPGDALASSCARFLRLAVAFLRRAISHFAGYGVRVERVMTDNGSAYRATIHALACKALGVKHPRTKPYRPRTNGKAERFIRTLLAGWAYGAIYRNSDERRRALAGRLDFYNHRRPHRSLSRQAPHERLRALMNNPLGSYLAG